MARAGLRTARRRGGDGPLRRRAARRRCRWSRRRSFDLRRACAPGASAAARCCGAGPAPDAPAAPPPATGDARRHASPTGRPAPSADALELELVRARSPRSSATPTRPPSTEPGPSRTSASTRSRRRAAQPARCGRRPAPARHVVFDHPTPTALASHLLDELVGHRRRGGTAQALLTELDRLDRPCVRRSQTRSERAHTAVAARLRDLLADVHGPTTAPTPTLDLAQRATTNCSTLVDERRTEPHPALTHRTRGVELT